MKQLIIKTAQITAKGNAILTFKGLPENVVAVKPIGSLLLTLDEVSKTLARIKPDTLVGAILTVEPTTDLQGNTIPGVIEAFKKGDAYTVTENNAVVKNGTINPLTNAPYQVGDTAHCDTDGVRITGRMNLQLSDAVSGMVINHILTSATNNVMNRVPASSSSNSSNVSTPEPTVTEETPEGAEEVIEGAENF